jgi:hypothetical protein
VALPLQVLIGEGTLELGVSELIGVGPSSAPRSLSQVDLRYQEGVIHGACSEQALVDLSIWRCPLGAQTVDPLKAPSERDR